LLSARTRAALPAQAERLLAYLTDHPELSSLDVGYSLAELRSAAHYRAAVVGADRTKLLDGLAALARSVPSAAVVQGAVRPQGTTAYLFSGHGTLRPRLGHALYQAFPVYAHSVDEISAIFDRYLSRPLPEVLLAEAGSLRAQLLAQATFAHAALLTTQVALYRLLESWAYGRTACSGTPAASWPSHTCPVCCGSRTP
jgi:acyl transferase domain-containing protein